MENEVKEPAPKYNYVSQEDYLEMERASDVKHEYYDGEVFAMSGASNEHNDITYNVNRIIAPFLHGKGCKLYGSDFRVHIPANTLYTYPDFTIVCGKTETTDVYTDNLTNPSVIIEILSKSTRDYDKGTKFTLYREINTLKEYILIDSTSIYVEHFEKEPDNSWRLTEFKQLSDSLLISTIQLRILLADLYEDAGIDMGNEVKEPAPKYNYISQEEYLEMENASETKHEYYDGEVFAMAGALLEHNIIVKNVNTHVLSFLLGKPCDMFGSDMRIHIPENTLYTYPDFSIICGKPEKSNEDKASIINPSVIIEVISRSTGDYDRGGKFSLYRSIKTLKEYILIDSLKVSVEVYTRQPDNTWLLRHETSLSGEFTISTIGLSLSLNDVYEDVQFED